MSETEAIAPRCVAVVFAKKQCGDEASFSNKNESEIDKVDIASRNSPYRARLNRAYIWGLSVLDELNLFG